MIREKRESVHSQLSLNVIMYLYDKDIVLLFSAVILTRGTLNISPLLDITAPE
jgi:hypothetical protein